MTVIVKQITRNIKVTPDRRPLVVRPTQRVIDVHTVGRRGPAGADSTVPGPEGPQGPPGETGVSDKNFVQNFTNSAEVTATHNLNKYPAVTITDSTGDEVKGDIVYNDINTVTLTFTSSFSGVAIFN